MTLRRLLTAIVLAGTLLAPDANAVRRRAVRVPAPPTHIMLDVAARDTLRYTNHGVVPDAVRTCLERTTTCITDLFQSGETKTYEALVQQWGRDTATLEIYANQPLEARGRSDAIPTSVATTSRQNIPIIDVTQTLTIYALGDGQAELQLLGSNGVEENSIIVHLQQGTNTIAPPFGSAAVGKQYDILPTSRTVVTTTVGGVQHRAKAFAEATGLHFILHATNDLVVPVKNIDPAAILAFDSLLYLPHTDNVQPAYLKNHDAINWGITLARAMTNGAAGAVGLQGIFRNQRNEPFLAWGTQTRDHAATANAGFGENGQRKYTTSLNQVPADRKVIVFNVSDANGPVSGTITGYDDAGRPTGTLPYQLRTWDNQEIDIASLNASRILVSANDAPSGKSTTPSILIGANVNGVHKPGYRVEKPTAQEPQYNITAEIYVKDNGQVLLQQSHPSAAVMKKLLNLDNLLFYDDKFISYACDTFPDPIVNTLPELIANYHTQLTPEEKQNFSGDEPGFRPYAANPCSSAPQNVYLVRVNFDRIN